MDRKFRPGHRGVGTARAQLRGTGRMSENRYAWLRTKLGNFTIMKYASGKYMDGQSEEGETLLLYIPRPGGGGRDFSYNITSLTSEELKKTREFFNLLFDEAGPIVEKRDQIATEAFSQGDDSFNRVYRALPQFIVRPRKVRENSEVLHVGSSDSPEGLGEEDDSDEGIRSDSEVLVNDESPEISSEDHES